MSNVDPFFSRANIHKALWSLPLALVGFGTATIWHAYRGKEKLLIATTDDGAKPIVVRVQKEPDDPGAKTLERIDVLVEEVRRLRQATSLRQRSPVSPKLNAATAVALQAETTTNAKEPALDVVTSPLNEPFVPRFELPSNVKGYRPASLGGFAHAVCPPHNIKSGDSTVIRLVLNTKTNVDELTPVFFSITRPLSNNILSQVSSGQFVLNKGLNQFQIPFELPVGAYDLEVGFYSRTELDREYPNLYGISCNVNVR